MFDMPLEAGTDSSAAKAMAERLGVGPTVRHLAVATLWIQEAVKRKHVNLLKLNGKYNVSDLGTKALDHVRMKELMTAIGCHTFNLSDKAVIKSDIINMKPKKWDNKKAVPTYDVGAIDQMHAAQSLFVRLNELTKEVLSMIRS